MANTNAEGYFKTYTSLVNEENLIEAFNNQASILNSFYNSVNEANAEYAYAPGKWSLKEMLQHLIDTERIFAYRALAIARKEPTTLPGFDENLYAQNSNGNNRTWQSLIEEMQVVRTATIMLFNSFDAEMLQHFGKFSSNTSCANEIGFIIIGHVTHHLNVVRERYSITL